MKEARLLSIFEVIKRGQERLEEERKRFDAMTPEQKAAALKEREVEDAETEEILKQLRGKPGFMEIKLK